MTIRDRYGREVNNIRVSVTQRCNLNCFYCHREGECASTGVEMTPAEIGRVISAVARLGIRKVKITGGEPLIREDITDIIRETKEIAGIEEVSMTTNGVLLGPLAKSLKMAGLNRVNVSLDSICDSTFEAITGSDSLREVLRGVDQALRAELTPVKINMVLLKGVNDTQVWPLVDFTRRKKIILQLIELESPRENEMYRKYHLDLSCVEQRIREQSREVLTRSMHHRQRFMLEGGGEVEIVKPMHNTEFCSYCNRIRVTSDGRFRPCLLDSEYLVDFLTPMRRGASDGELERLFLQAVRLRRPFFTERCIPRSKTRL